MLPNRIRSEPDVKDRIRKVKNIDTVQYISNLVGADKALYKNCVSDPRDIDCWKIENIMRLSLLRLFYKNLA
jgi:hypothetical protein